MSWIWFRSIQNVASRRHPSFGRGGTSTILFHLSLGKRGQFGAPGLQLACSLDWWMYLDMRADSLSGCLVPKVALNSMRFSLIYLIYSRIIP